jgi:hypothetical protein
MPVTIKVNGTVNSLVHKMSNGISTATIPDLCKTPSPGGPVPIPYPNIAQSITLTGGTTSVKGDRMMAATKGSKFALSNGDQAGTLGGVKSSVFMKEATWILYSFDVKLDGKNACRFTDKMFHNSENCANLSGIINPPVVDAQFEAIMQECVNNASDAWNARNGGPPSAQHCQSEARRNARGREIEEEALACIEAGMASAGRSNELSVDQSYTRSGGTLRAVGQRGQVIPNTVRPDLVLHAPGAPTAVRAVYDIKCPCPPGSNSPSWSNNQGADYVSIFQTIPKLVSPHNAIVTGAFTVSATSGALTAGAKAFQAALKLFRVARGLW